jgi:hypothetical protein
MNTKKLRNFRANPTVYYTHQSDKRFENHHENTVRTNMQFWYSVEKFTCETRGSSERLNFPMQGSELPGRTPEFHMFGGQYFAANFRTSYRNDAYDMALERYTNFASFLFLFVFEIMYDLKLI